MKLLFILDTVEFPLAPTPALARRAAGLLAQRGHTVHLLELWDGRTPPPAEPGCESHLLSFGDERRMNEAAQVLMQYTDFTSFSKLHTDVKTNNCRIYQAGWEREGDLWVFTIQADRFLRNMVRAIVGTLLEVGRGRLTTEGVRRVIEAKDRCRAGTSVPGHALFLEDIAYPDALFCLD